MAWKIIFDAGASKQLSKLDPPTQKSIVKFLYNRVEAHPNPITLAEPLKGNLAFYYRFRLGDYRILVVIDEVNKIIKICEIGNRKDVYR